MPRTEITKQIWAYIRRTKLQDSVQKRVINADEKMRALFGKAKADMFEMTKLVNKYIIKYIKIPPPKPAKCGRERKPPGDSTGFFFGGR